MKPGSRKYERRWSRDSHTVHPELHGYSKSHTLWKGQAESDANKYMYSSSILDRINKDLTPPPSTEMCTLSQGISSEVEITAAFAIASLRVEEQTPDDVDHDVLSLDGNTSVQGQVDITPTYTGASSLNFAEMSRLASHVEDDGSQEILTPATEYDSGEEWPTDRHALHGVHKHPRRSSNLEMLTSSSYAMGIARQDLVKDGMTAVIFFDSKWTANLTNHAGDKGSASNSTPTPSSSTLHKHNTPLTDYGRKRSWKDEGNPPTDGDGEPPEGSELNPRKPQDPRRIPKLACPFRKHDAEKYNQDDYLACVTRYWLSISRLK